MSTVTIVNEEPVTVEVTDPDTGDKEVIQIFEKGAPGQDGATDGVVEAFIAATTLSALRLVYVDDGGQIRYADKDDAASARRIAGMTLAAASLGASCNVLLLGMHEDVNWSWNVDGDRALFLGAGGVIVQGKPNAAVIMRVGTVITATKILLRLGEPLLSA